MSAKLSNNSISKKTRKFAKQVPVWRQKFGRVLLVVGWAALSLFLADGIVFGLTRLITKTRWLDTVNPAVVNSFAMMLVFAISLLILFTSNRLLVRRLPKIAAKLKISKTEIGWGGWLTWQQLLLGIASFIATMVVVALILSLIKQIFPSFPIEQVQEIGIKASHIYWRGELLVVFLLLVVMTPIAEELIFRGFLYGKIRQNLPIWATTIIVSLLFGVAHGQWNVGVVTFVMSVAMCLTREATGSIYPAIILHAIKNGLAFALIYILKIQ